MMFKLIVLLSFFAIDLGDSNTHIRVKPIIIGGLSADIKDIPYQISLHIGSKFVCGGSILSPTHIVTAAHCVNNYAADIKNNIPYTIRAGSSLNKDGGVSIPLKNSVYHPKYAEATTDYDVAIMELSTPLKYSDTIQPIQIPTQAAPDGAMVTASGWGCLKEKCEMAVELQAVDIPVVSRSTCEKNYKKYLKITPRMMCAGTEGKDACQGDSGGPLAYGKTLVGISSTGVGCARKDLPGVYVNVLDPEIREFIKKHSNV